MKNCAYCGTQFEGAFCPECGQKWETEKTCPQCGGKLSGGAKFCSDCGYSFVGEGKATGKDGERVIYLAFLTKSRLAKSFRLIPTILILLFSLLMFAFMAAPIATVIGESLGNIYELSKGSEFMEDLQGYAKLVLFSSIASAVFSVTYFYYVFAVPRKKIRLSKTLYLDDVLSVLSALILLFFFILGCVGASKIKEDGISTGAFVVLTITFSIIFFILSVGATVLRYLPQSRARQEKPISPQEVKNFSVPDCPELTAPKEAWIKTKKYAKQKCGFEIFFLILLTVAIAVISINLFNMLKQPREWLRENRIGLIVFSSFLILFVLMWITLLKNILGYFASKKDAIKLVKTAKKGFVNAFASLILIAEGAIIVLFFLAGAEIDPTSISHILTTLVVLVPFIFSIIVLSARHGWRKSSAVKKLLANYKQYKPQYKAYNVARKKAEKQEKRYQKELGWYQYDLEKWKKENS